MGKRASRFAAISCSATDTPKNIMSRKRFDWLIYWLIDCKSKRWNVDMTSCKNRMNLDCTDPVNHKGCAKKTAILALKSPILWLCFPKFYIWGAKILNSKLWKWQLPQFYFLLILSRFFSQISTKSAPNQSQNLSLPRCHLDI